MNLYKKILHLKSIKNVHYPKCEICHPHVIFHNFIKSFSRPFEMPKNNKTSFDTKKARVKEPKSARFPPGEIYLCVLGNGSISSPRALYMFTDHKRYLFNCGEGTQRLAQEHRTKLSKLEHVFITYGSWENTGGLLGLSLTLQEIGLEQITLHGPPNVDMLYEHASSFTILKSLKIRKKSFTDKKFIDECMEVCYIPIYPDTYDLESAGSSSGTDSADSNCQDSDKADSSLEHKSKKLCTRKKNKQKIAVSYACKGHSKPGHLSFEKCIELGVPLGPLLGCLKRGEDVTLPSGKVVYSQDVVSEAQHCSLFLVVDCPSIQYLDSFVNEEKFHLYQMDSPVTSHVASLVVHFTPPEILKSSKYQQWMNKFPDSTHHLILNSDNSTLCSLAVHRIQYKLNLLHPGIYRLLQERDVNEKCFESHGRNVLQANTLERYYLRPAKGFDRSVSLKLNPKEFIEEAMHMEKFEETLKTLKSNIHQQSVLQTNASIYPIVTFLGTGSCIPNKARNVSAILITISDNNCMLLDCGEGTYGQLVRLYGENHRKILEFLTCIFISHLHADHHLGLIKILKAREAIYRKLGLQYKPVHVIGPWKLNAWLKSYHKTFEHLTYLYRFTECSELDDPFKFQHDSIIDIQDIKMSTILVHHCPNAYGIMISQKSSEWKLVYSGDTMPCQRLVNAGQNCSILIHEATMEDELANEAAIKKHSTTSEAIKIGEQMKSQYTILTHFSQRYAKIPLFNENFHDNIGCAFDNMTVSANEMYILPLFIPTLKCLFAEEVEEMNIKGDKRRRKIETVNSMINESISKETVEEKT